MWAKASSLPHSQRSLAQLCPLTSLHNPVAAADLHCTSKPHFMCLPIFKASILPFHTPDPVTIEWVSCIHQREEGGLRTGGSEVVRAAVCFQGRR